MLERFGVPFLSRAFKLEGLVCLLCVLHSCSDLLCGGLCVCI